METIFITVHGFNEEPFTSGLSRVITPGLLARRKDCYEFIYGKASLLDVRFSNDNLAYALRSFVSAVLLAKARTTQSEHVRVVLIGHSNGCALIRRAGQLGHGFPKSARAIFLSPALNRSSKMPDCFEKVFVYYTKTDLAVGASSLLLFHEWGSMGKHGYDGPEDKRVINLDYSGFVVGHSGWFETTSGVQRWDSEWLVNSVLENADA